MAVERSELPPARFRPGSDGGWEINFEVANPRSIHFLDRKLRCLVPLVEEAIRGDVLDCGCGNAPFVQVYGANADHLVLVDRAAGLPFLDARVDLDRGLPFRGASFDAVLLSDVLEHVPRPSDLLEELHRVLRPGGRLLLSVPFLYPVHEAPYDFFRYTEFGLRALLAGAGFRLDHLASMGGYPDSVLNLITKAVSRNVRAARLFHLVSVLAASSGLVNRWRVRTAESTPLGYVILATCP